MRNPIQSSPDRPLPLPDCILMDAWWADLRVEDTDVRRAQESRVGGGEGRHERERPAGR